MRYPFLSLAVIPLLSAPLFADFQYQETTKMTGGFVASMARFGGRRALEPVVHTVAVKGNRMVTYSDKSAQIIDLNKETVAHIDYEAKTYYVMTFEQMRQMMEDAMQRMQERGQQGDQKADLSFDASVRETGKSKVVNGISAQEFILTMAMKGTDKQTGQSGAINMTNDMWMAPEVPGYEEVREFHKRMAEKLGSVMQGMNPAQGMRPEMGKGLAAMAKEMSKLKGIPVMQVMRMGSTPDGKPLPAASEAPELASQSEMQMPSSGEIAGRAATGASTGAADRALGRLGGLAGGMGGLGGFGRKKPQQDQQQQQQQAEQAKKQAQAGPMVLMESTTELTSFSSSADGSKFDVPGGFKQVDPPDARRRGR